MSTTPALTDSAAIAALPAALQGEARALIRRGSVKPSGYDRAGRALFSVALLRTAAEVTGEEARRAKLGEHRVSALPPPASSRSPSGPTTAAAGSVRLGFARA
jgi:hypothetical protein